MTVAEQIYGRGGGGEDCTFDVVFFTVENVVSSLLPRAA